MRWMVLCIGCSHTDVIALFITATLSGGSVIAVEGAPKTSSGLVIYFLMQQPELRRAQRVCAPSKQRQGGRAAIRHAQRNGW